MIKKRTGNGQTECYGCKQKGKYSLTWDSFLYTFNDKPYCFDCLMEMLEAYENMRKEAIDYLQYFNCDEICENITSIAKNLENILNKVGGSDE